MGVLYENAEVFARLAHADLVGINGRPFIEHPLAVAALFEDEVIKAAAILHDVVEKTDITLAEISEQFGDDVASLVDNLTVREGESKESQLQRALLDPRSAAIRIADALNHADVRNWKDSEEDFDIDKVGGYIDKVEALLKELGFFGGDTLKEELVKPIQQYPSSVTAIPLNNTAKLLGPELNKARERALQNSVPKLPPELGVN